IRSAADKSASPGSETGGAGLGEHAGEARGFVDRGGASRTSDAVVAAPRVVLLGIGALIELFDETLAPQPVDGAVERPGTELELALGARRDVLHDGVAVAVAVGKGDEDMERGWCHGSTITASDITC